MAQLLLLLLLWIQPSQTMLTLTSWSVQAYQGPIERLETHRKSVLRGRTLAELLLGCMATRSAIYTNFTTFLLQ